MNELPLIEAWFDEGWKMIGTEPSGNGSYRAHMSRGGRDHPVYVCTSHLRELTEKTLLSELKAGGSNV